MRDTRRRQHRPHQASGPERFRTPLEGRGLCTGCHHCLRHCPGEQTQPLAGQGSPRSVKGNRKNRPRRPRTSLEPCCPPWLPPSLRQPDSTGLAGERSGWNCVLRVKHGNRRETGPGACRPRASRAANGKKTFHAFTGEKNRVSSQHKVKHYLGREGTTTDRVRLGSTRDRSREPSKWKTTRVGGSGRTSTITGKEEPNP